MTANLKASAASATASILSVRRRHVTREGLWWLVTGVLLWGIGLYRGINLLTFLGILIAVSWAANLWLIRRRLSRLEARRWFPAPAFAGTPFSIHLELVNAGAKEEWGVRLRDHGPAHDAAFFAVRLPPGGRCHWRHELTVPWRGRYEMPPLAASNGYPLGLIERVVAAPAGETLLIFPRLFRLRRGRLRHFLMQAAAGAGKPRGRPQPHPTAQTEFHGLRPFRTGDSPRLIHWKTSARRNALMVREFEDTPTDNLVLVVDPWVADTAAPRHERLGDGERSPDELRELTLSLAATICDTWCRQNGDQFVFALAGAEPIVVAGTTGSALALRTLEALALVAETPPGPGPDLAGLLGGTILPPGPVLVLTPLANDLGGRLAARLHRRVASLDPLSAQEYELVEWESDHAS